MIRIRREARVGEVSDLSGARSDWTNKLGNAGVTRWQTRRRARLGTTAMLSAGAPPHWKVLLWVAVTLLPLVEGAGLGADVGQTVGLMDEVEERQYPDTLPEVEEEQEEERGPATPWYGLHDHFGMGEANDYQSGRWAGRSPRSSDPTDADPKGSDNTKKKRKKKDKDKHRERKGKTRALQQSSRDCRVEKREMQVRDLGLGFDSEEIVLFKFCVGSCRSSRTNYDLALRALMENGSLARRTSRRVSAHPCCRPDRYEPVSFMDTHTTWQTIQSLSAASCRCMG